MVLIAILLVGMFALVLVLVISILTVGMIVILTLGVVVGMGVVFFSVVCMCGVHVYACVEYICMHV